MFESRLQGVIVVSIMTLVLFVACFALAFAAI